MDTNPYPYDIDPDRHPFSWVFFNAPGAPAFDLDVCENLAKHVFDNLGCSRPGAAQAPAVKYDALGGSGAPWEPGRWIKADEARAEVHATVPDVDISAMTPDQRTAYLAEVQAAVDAANDSDKDKDEE